jgi:hypothetical protein
MGESVVHGSFRARWRVVPCLRCARDEVDHLRLPGLAMNDVDNIQATCEICLLEKTIASFKRIGGADSFRNSAPQ